MQYSAKLVVGIDSVTPIKTIIWDWNGTLLDDASIGLEVLNSIFADYDVAPITLARYREIYGHPVQQIYEKSGFDLTKLSFEAISAEWHRRYLQRLESSALHSDTNDTLEFVHSNGITQTILSALPHDILVRSVIHHRLDRFFTDIQGIADSLSRGKLENGSKMMGRLSALPEETVIVGDSTHDAEVAHALGTRCYLVSRGFESRSRLEKHGVPVFDNFVALRLELSAVAGKETRTAQ